ncbi:MAG: histidine kinase [Rhodoglobus sp.]
MLATKAPEAMAVRLSPLWGVGYGRRWRRMPAELAYLITALPIVVIRCAVVLFVITSAIHFLLATFFIGSLISFLFTCAVLIVGAPYLARGLGTLDLLLLEWTGCPAIPRPEWQDARSRNGLSGWIRAVLGNRRYWLYMLHTAVVGSAITTVSWAITVIWIMITVGGLTFWLWNPTPATINDQDWYLSGWSFSGAGFDARVADNLLCCVLGIIFLTTLPFVTHGLISVHWLVARGMLSAGKIDALQRQITNLSESRGAAQFAEGHSLRRLERDIHDGPQQRLVRLHIDLAAADRQLDRDPEKARGLIAEAMQQSQHALEELRALSRGFAPPILLDRGLIAALESAAVRASVPTRIIDELPMGIVLEQETERNAYFISSEAMMNAAKHSRATQIEVRVSHVVVEVESWLVITVTDNGIGGAVSIAGHGIDGLQERLRGLGGVFELLSPVGGPTIITARIPHVFRHGSPLSHASLEL